MTNLERPIGLIQATAMVAGIIIGASIFVQPSEINRHVPSVAGILSVSSFTAAEPLSIRRWTIPERESSIAKAWTFPPIHATIFVDDWDALW
jgi:hypothetical protein